MRENPSLVPEKMVAFKNESTKKKKKCWSKRAGHEEVNQESKVTQRGQECDCPSAECRLGEETPWVLDRAAESWVAVRTAAFIYCVFCVSAPQSRQLPSVKRTQDARCEASFWPHGAMATPTKQQRAEEGGRREGREQGWSEWWGQHRQAANPI